MLLAVDIGNTHTVAGLFDDGVTEDGTIATEPMASWRVRTEVHATADEVAAMCEQLLGLRGLGLPDVAMLVVSSVVPSLSSSYREFALRYLDRDAQLVGPGMRTGMRIEIDNPHEVGADRIVNAVAAYERYHGACIVVDLGTATTFDAVAADGAYLGGAIAPGLGTSVEALVAHAARLASVELAVPERAIGTNTIASMQSGAVLGTIAQVEGMLARFRDELVTDTHVPAIATGGLSSMLEGHVRGLDDVDPLLTLRGLRLLASRQ